MNCHTDVTFWRSVPVRARFDAVAVLSYNDDEAYLTGGFCFEEGSVYCRISGPHGINGGTCSVANGHRARCATDWPLPDFGNCPVRGGWPVVVPT